LWKKYIIPLDKGEKILAVKKIKIKRSRKLKGRQIK